MIDRASRAHACMHMNEISSAWHRERQGAPGKVRVLCYVQQCKGWQRDSLLEAS